MAGRTAGRPRLRHLSSPPGGQEDTGGTRERKEAAGKPETQWARLQGRGMRADRVRLRRLYTAQGRPHHRSGARLGPTHEQQHQVEFIRAPPAPCVSIYRFADRRDKAREPFSFRTWGPPNPSRLPPTWRHLELQTELQGPASPPVAEWWVSLSLNSPPSAALPPSGCHTRLARSRTSVAPVLHRLQSPSTPAKNLCSGPLWVPGLAYSCPLAPPHHPSLVLLFLRGASWSKAEGP